MSGATAAGLFQEEVADGPHLRTVHPPKWYACYTRANQEKKVFARLEERGVDSYLPATLQKRQWHDRVKLIACPLFPSYVFARFELQDLYDILAVPGIAAVVRVAGRVAPISEEEIANIQRFVEALSGHANPAVVHAAFDEGDPVRIVSGPFQGVEGRVIRAQGRQRVLVGLKTVGLGFEVDVSAASLARLQ